MKLYVDANTKLEDARSTASAFTIVGVIGIIALILLDTGALPIQLATPSQVMVNVVMGVLFLIFLMVGIRSMFSIRKLTESVDEEQNREQEILSWFRDSYRSVSQATNPIPKTANDTESSGDSEQSELYFSRYEQMSSHLLTQYPDLQEEYVDHLVELLYEEFYPEA